MPFADRQRVYVAEYGHGARIGNVVRSYHDGQHDRVVVKLEDQDHPRDCFATSVFPTAAEAATAAT